MSYSYLEVLEANKKCYLDDLRECPPKFIADRQTDNLVSLFSVGGIEPINFKVILHVTEHEDDNGKPLYDINIEMISGDATSLLDTTAATLAFSEYFYSESDLHRQYRLIGKCPD